MSVSNEKLLEIQERSDRCSDFIMNTTLPIKKEHSDNIEKYLDRFIKFPGFTTIISVIFKSSDLVQNPEMATVGMVTAIISFMIALNIFREGIKIDKIFIDKINKIEEPMLKLSKKLTVFSRENTNQDKENDLLEAYEELDKSYQEDILNGYVVDSKRIYNQINLSFWILVIGIIISILSTFKFC